METISKRAFWLTFLLAALFVVLIGIVCWNKYAQDSDYYQKIVDCVKAGQKAEECARAMDSPYSR